MDIAFEECNRIWLRNDDWKLSAYQTTIATAAFI